MSNDIEITDPDALLANACKIGPIGGTIDIPIVEAARIVLERIRVRAKTAPDSVKRRDAMIARHYKRLLELELSLTEEAKKYLCECGARLGKTTWLPSRVKRRNGSMPLCRACALRKGAAALTPEQRSEISRKAAAALTPEQRSEAGRKANAARTPEQRSEKARKANAARWAKAAAQ